MKTTKMSLANIQGKLSRTEMKNIMAGSGSGTCTTKCFTSSGGNLSCVADFMGTCVPSSNCSNASTCK